VTRGEDRGRAGSGGVGLSIARHVLAGRGCRNRAARTARRRRVRLPYPEPFAYGCGGGGNGGMTGGENFATPGRRGRWRDDRALVGALPSSRAAAPPTTAGHVPPNECGTGSRHGTARSPKRRSAGGDGPGRAQQKPTKISELGRGARAIRAAHKRSASAPRRSVAGRAGQAGKKKVKRGKRKLKRQPQPSANARRQGAKTARRGAGVARAKKGGKGLSLMAGPEDPVLRALAVPRRWAALLFGTDDPGKVRGDVATRSEKRSLVIKAGEPQFLTGPNAGGPARQFGGAMAKDEQRVLGKMGLGNSDRTAPGDERRANRPE